MSATLIEHLITFPSSVCTLDGLMIRGEPVTLDAAAISAVEPALHTRHRAPPQDYCVVHLSCGSTISVNARAVDVARAWRRALAEH